MIMIQLFWVKEKKGLGWVMNLLWFEMYKVTFNLFFTISNGLQMEYKVSSTLIEMFKVVFGTDENKKENKLSSEN